jgi:hypothetical protein
MISTTCTATPCSSLQIQPELTESNDTLRKANPVATRCVSCLSVLRLYNGFTNSIRMFCTTAAARQLPVRVDQYYFPVTENQRGTQRTLRKVLLRYKPEPRHRIFRMTSILHVSIPPRSATVPTHTPSPSRARPTPSLGSRPDDLLTWQRAHQWELPAIRLASCRQRRVSSCNLIMGARANTTHVHRRQLRSTTVRRAIRRPSLA